MLAGCKRPFKARDGRRLRSHALRNLSLGQSSVASGFQQQVKKCTFLALNALNFPPDTRPTHQLGNYLIMSSHV